MKTMSLATALSLGCWLLAVSQLRAADDTVTLPKSRLEELQRKEAELDKLKSDLLRKQDELNKAKGDLDKTKGDLNQTKTDLDKAKGENTQLKQQQAIDAATIARTPAAPAYQSPPMASLPPLNKAEPVNAMDLANYYRADPAAADQRFDKQSFSIQGEIVSFEKVWIVRSYRAVLKSPDRDVQVVCEVQPPDKYKAVFAARNGTEMVGSQPRYEDETIVRVGDVVILHGECKGLKDSRVVMGGCELKSIVKQYRGNPVTAK